MIDYPAFLAQAGHSAPAPRRVRGMLAGRTVFDTTNARYVWERPGYPQYFIPVKDFPEKRFKLMMEVQVYAPFHLSQLVLPGMIRPRCRKQQQHSSRIAS